MSMPYDFDDEGGRRWAVWRKKAKRSKSASRPRQIRLPDTAVSGTTIGGHRHIAITIPLEAFPLGEAPRSQYPVYSKRDSKALVPRQSLAKTVVNDKGVVTVLRTVDEELSVSARAISQFYSTRSLPRTPSHSGRAGEREYMSVPPNRASESVAFGDQKSAPKNWQASLRFYPARVSSKATGDPHENISIDGMISRPDDSELTPILSRYDARDYDPNDEWPLPLKNKKRPKPQTNWDQHEEMTGISKESGARILKENPLGPRKEASPPATPTSTKSRREKVRDKKRRDMETQRAKQNQQEGKEQDALTLSRIHVVVNVRPCSPTENAPPQPGPKHPARKSPIIPAWSRPTNLTPPLSPNTSLIKKQSALDRTALSRRREWKATREQERKTKEARAAVRARAKQLSAGVDESEDAVQTLDDEILRLYEAYREHRFRDMERRVRRLEKNGDVWLRALVPVLDNLNRNIPSSEEDVEQRAWMSDDEPTKRPVYKCNAEPLKRSNSANTLREEGAQAKAESRCGSSGSDMSGLDTIEPLMRELAGAARLRQLKSGELMHAY